MSDERKIVAEYCGKTTGVVQKKDKKVRLILKGERGEYYAER